MKMPPRLAVARATATDIALFPIIATGCENYSSTRKPYTRRDLQLFPWAGVHDV